VTGAIPVGSAASASAIPVGGAASKSAIPVGGAASASAIQVGGAVTVIPVGGFDGARDGYEFLSDEFGVGYYKEGAFGEGGGGGVCGYAGDTGQGGGGLGVGYSKEGAFGGGGVGGVGGNRGDTGQGDGGVGGMETLPLVLRCALRAYALDWRCATLRFE